MNGRLVRREVSIECGAAGDRVCGAAGDRVCGAAGDRVCGEAHPTRSVGRAAALLIPVALVGGLFAGACTTSRPPAASSAPARPPASAAPAPSRVDATPAWFAIRMTDVQTGRDFAIGDFSGRVILVEAMAEWCPTCIEQQREVQAFRDGLSNPDDLVSISLDIDVNEDAASLKGYAAALQHDWRYAVAPLDVARALGNLYSAEYLNPPYSPMLLIDRHSGATQLPYGVKKADYLRTTLEPYLAP